MSHAQNEGNLDARSRWRRLGQTLKGAVFSVVQGLRERGQCSVLSRDVGSVKQRKAFMWQQNGSFQKSVSFM